MAVPGRKVPAGAPAGLADAELFAVDAYVREFDSPVLEVDEEQRRVALRRTAFYPGGGGQPYDLGVLRWADGVASVSRVKREGSLIWHWLDGDQLPDPRTEVHGELDWERRHLTMRTHTALQADGGTHVVSTAEIGSVAVTGTESRGKANKRIRIEVR